MPKHACYLMVVLGAVVGLAACDHHDSDEHAQHAEHASSMALELNDGEKWPVDEHTRRSAAKITDLVTASDHLQSVDEARLLAGDIDKELGQLVQGCTMTGPAHDQLHIWLVALFPKVAELKEHDHVADLQKTRDDISDLLQDYSAHFEM